MWGEWHKKPHYWGAGAFHGTRGTVSFWVKAQKLKAGIVFMQGSVAWGRKERDLFTVEVDGEGRFSAHIRDVAYQYHQVEAQRPTWEDDAWQHLTVVYDHAYGLKLYHNGRMVGSTWGEDAWWLTNLPGLFSPFLEKSHYDEIRFFDVTLTDAQIADLYLKNSFEGPALTAPLDEAGRGRLLSTFGPLETLELPTLRAGEGLLRLTQVEVADARDESIPVWWTFDGRYELAWPHPYRLFTFILGDADFHGTQLDINLGGQVRPNYLFFEGILSGLRVLSGEDGTFQKDPVVALEDYKPFFYSAKLEDESLDSLRLPFLKSHGSPEGLEGSTQMPLTGPTRIHEINLWHADATGADAQEASKHHRWPLAARASLAGFDRYAAALEKLKTRYDRRVFTGSLTPMHERQSVEVEPLQSVFFTDPGLLGDVAVDALRLHLSVHPRGDSDVWWLKLRDPANPSRIWAQACMRIEYESDSAIQTVNIELDIIDLMLAAEDRILLEFTSANGCSLIFGEGLEPSSLSLLEAPQRTAALAAYAKHELLPAQMQFTKQYNYRPWIFTGERMDLQSWNVLGGPFDMAYPPLAVLRHDPDHALANTYRSLIFDRRWFGRREAHEGRVHRAPKAPPQAPPWAIWQRELIRVNKEITDWIVGQQRDDGMFWGGSNDDPFIPLGWAALPLLGDETSRASWLRFYDGLEALGVYKDGYCDIWPIDPMHIQDFIVSRPLMLINALGDPQVFERELLTARRYFERVSAVNQERAQEGLPPLSGERTKIGKEEEATLVQQMDANNYHYSRTHVGWYWGEAPAPEAHQITDRSALAHEFREAVQQVDDKAVFAFTEARIHTDQQGAGICREVLVRSALGGRLQGRSEAFPPTIAVSWSGVAVDRVARLVSYANEKALRVSLYNFGEGPATMAMRVLRLEPGVYRVSEGTDSNGDSLIDEPKGSPREMRLERFSVINLELPAHMDYAIEVEQVKGLEVSKALPDLALTGEDIARDENGRVQVTVHNIGAAAAEAFDVRLLSADGQELERQTVKGLESPMDDLAARRVTVGFDVETSDSDLRVVVEPKRGTREILLENNMASLRQRKSEGE
jgi:hypothetical protein